MSPGTPSGKFVARDMPRAVSEQDCFQIRRLHEMGADLNASDSVGLSYLQNAANDGRLQSAETLLQLGANPDQTGGGSGWTALHYAAYRNNNAMTELLLKHGANPNTPSTEHDHDTPLLTAAFAGDMHVVMTLVNAGADVMYKDKRGHTAMEIATLRAEERFQFAQKPFVEVAVYLKRKMDEVTQAAEAAKAQQDKVSNDLAALKSKNPKHFKLKM